MTIIDQPLLPRTAAAAALLLTFLCTITLATGVSQQLFEWVHAPSTYAAWLVRDASALRVIIALDDVFIMAYTASAVLFARALFATTRHPLPGLALAFSVAAGVLDLAENHHLLALLRAAEAGLSISLDEILLRSQLSQLKWMLGHVAFAFLGLSLSGAGRVERLMRASLVYVQLPLGALTWAVPDGLWLTALRHGRLPRQRRRSRATKAAICARSTSQKCSVPRRSSSCMRCSSPGSLNA